MKTFLAVVIETPDIEDLNVYPRPFEEKEPEEYTTKEDLEEVSVFRKLFSEELHETVINQVKLSLDDINLEDGILDELWNNDLGIESWETLADYGIKITVKNENDKR